MMRLPVLLMLDENEDALNVLKAQLSQRYAHDYRVEGFGDPDLALQRLIALADAGEPSAWPPPWEKARSRYGSSKPSSPTNGWKPLESTAEVGQHRDRLGLDDP
jgi:hypothetical protein